MSSLLRARWTLAALLASLGACGGGSTAPPPPVSVSVTPNNSTIGAAGTQTLTATVTNASNTGLIWTSTGGSVAAAGHTAVFTAPVPGGTYTVTATSVQDPTKSGSASIAVTPVSVTVTPGDRAAFRGEPINFTAAVSGTTVNTAVTWTSTCGTTVPNQLQLAYTAPTQVTTCDVQATSVLDPNKSDASRVSVRGASAVTVGDNLDDGACTWEHCSLREAIDDANAAPNRDTIYLGAAAAGAPPRGAHSGRALGPILQSPFDPLPILMTRHGHHRGRLRQHGRRRRRLAGEPEAGLRDHGRHRRRVSGILDHGWSGEWNGGRGRDPRERWRTPANQRRRGHG